MWAGFVELVRVIIFSAAHLCAGSLGAGILGVSLAVRLALLPLTLRLARQARAQQARLAALRPKLDALQRRHAHDPARLMRETQALYAAHGIRFLSPMAFVGWLVQLPLLSGLFAAVRTGLGARVRFLWIADLARPNALLLVAVALLTAGSTLVVPQTAGPRTATGTAVLLLLSLGGTLVFLWSASSAVTLSVGAGSLVSALQAWLLRRERNRAAPSA